MRKRNQIIAWILFFSVLFGVSNGQDVVEGKTKTAISSEVEKDTNHGNRREENSGSITKKEAMVETASVESAGIESPKVESQDVEYQNSRFVTTQYGKIEGKKTTRAYIWYGIPYGTTKRWQAPTAPKSWSGIKKCKKKKKGKGDKSLFVNVYKPSKGKTDDLPVMVFLHGGGNAGGSANKSFGKFVEDTKSIVVSVEFRQGAFGWFQSRGLKTGNALTDSGNFAMLDIKLALEWVQKNISAFGGDAGNVTLSGFSAGARDSLNCLISPQMKGLFHKVISFSGGMTTCSKKEGRKWSNQRLARVLVRRGRFANQKKALRYVKRLSKKKLRRLLYSLSDRELRNMVDSTGLRLTNFPQCFRDGKIIPKEGFDVLEWGEYNRVPMIIGANQSEFANVSYKTMQRILVKNPRTFRNQKQFYRLLKTARKYGSKMQSSFYLEKVAMKLAKDPYHQDLYAYRFAWAENANVVGKRYAKYIGSIHGMDVDFLLERYKKGEADADTSIYKKSNQKGREDLSMLMKQYVKNFLYTGNPNGTDEEGKTLAAWQKWRNVKKSNRIMKFSASKTKAKANMTSKYIKRTKVKRQMRRKLSKGTYRFLKNRILNDRFFMD